MTRRKAPAPARLGARLTPSHSVSLQLQLARNGLLCRDLQLAEVLAVMRRELGSSSLQEFRTGLEEMGPAAQLDVFACMLQLIAVVRP